MNKSYSLLPECPLLNKSLGFNGSHYTYWKQKMRDFVKATDIDMSDNVESRYEFARIMADGIV